ncbi:helix-turn-helix transcriptional regulator [Nesterenkonia muleiensis]|uniref:helix-turn-helix transcriptional regulator n=1 Tax=Nesterenkonia muleiensis TaxID=2282648 RepID=UPI000E7561B5|nr:WYL domain-containing protein [Nesterenkonia muleiensis]
MQHHEGDTDQQPRQTAAAEDGVVRALSMANALLNHPGGLSREQIFDKVELYRARRDERDRLTGVQRKRADAALEKLFGHDKAHLRSCGIALSEPSSEDDYRYRIDRRQYGLPDLQLTADEHMALHRAQLLFAHHHIAGLQHALWAINPDYQDVVSPLAPRALQASIGSEAELSHLIDVATIGTRIPVTFRYTGRGRSGAETRRVVPLATGAQGHWYLIAHDLDRDQQRLFRLDRVTGSITALPAATLTEAEAEVVGQIASERLYAQLDVSAVLEPTERQFAERELLCGALRAHQGPAPQTLPKLTDPPGGLRKDDAAAKTERVVNMIALLLAGGGVRPSQLLVKYAITEEQLLRDLLSISLVNTHGFPDTLDVQPFPPLNDEQFVSEYLTADEPIVLHPGSGVLDKPVSLTKPGALSLMIALKALIEVCPAADEHIARAAENLQQKILGIVPRSIAQAAMSMSLSRASADGPLLQTAGEAMDAGYALDLEYADASGRYSSRTIEPVQIVYDGPHTYLRAWCRHAEGERFFRLSRILRMTALPQAAQGAEAAALDLSQSPRPQVPVTAESVPVVLRFAPCAAAQAVMYSPVKQHTDKQTGTRTISTHFATQEAAVRVCLEAGGDIEVIRPAELREEVRRRAEDALAPS